MYHYATVSKALDELNENGFTYDFNLHEEDIVKNPTKYEIKHIYRYEGNTDPGDEAVVYGIQSTSGKKGVFVAGFAANSISDAAQALTNISIKNRTK
jgi:ABC-type phosphate transport system substrate-binding protein